jgi:hypothetical protein
MKSSAGPGGRPSRYSSRLGGWAFRLGASHLSHELTADRPLSDPDKAARKLVEIANTAEAVQDGRIHIELINTPFLQGGGSPAEYKAGLNEP